MRDRGQSELLGFAFIFGIVLLTITLVVTTGYVGLQNAQEHEQTNNAQLAFTVLADNLDDISRHGAPSRATELKLSDATLSTGDPVTITVSGDDFTYNETVHPIVYDSRSGTEIVYSNGALLRQDDESTVLTRDPNFVLTNDTVIIPIVDTYSDKDESIGVSGQSTVLVQTRHANSELHHETEGVDEITLEITSPRADAWEHYLSEEPATDCTRNDDTVSCTVTTERVYISVDQIAVTVD